VLMIGLIELVCLALYILPRTAVLGAILLTGFLGGAFAINLRAGMPTFNQIFPFIIGALMWGGLYLRERRLGALLPVR
jgi:DoxX-like family